MKTIIEMELTESYDTMDPFIHENLFYVTEDIDILDLNVSFQMEGEHGLLEIADNQSKEVLWSNTWDDHVKNSSFVVSLNHVEKENEYVVRFTGTNIQYTKLIMFTDDTLVKGREKPVKPNSE